MKYEVAITYKGQLNYLVEADDPETAKALATQRYADGEAGDPLGNEWQVIEKIVPYGHVEFDSIWVRPTVWSHDGDGYVIRRD